MPPKKKRKPKAKRPVIIRRCEVCDKPATKRDLIIDAVLCDGIACWRSLWDRVRGMND